jgi:hypothetical protein
MSMVQEGERVALGFVDRWLLRVAMLLALLALVLWYASLTVFQPGRVDAVVDTVLSSAHVQRETADEILQQVKQFAPGSAMSQQVADAVTKQMGNDPHLQQLLASYTGHGSGTSGTMPIGSVTGTDIAPAQVDAIFHSAVQRVDPKLAASLTGVHLHVTPAGLAFTASQIPSMDDANTIAAHAWPWLLLLAVVLWVLAFLLSSARYEVVRRLGRWLVAVAVVQVLLLVVGPWLAVRYVDAEWAPRYAATATLWGSRVLVPILVMGAIGVALTLVARVEKAHAHPSGAEGVGFEPTRSVSP